MAVFHIDIRVAATAYIVADTPEEARKKAESLNGFGLIVAGESILSAEPFDSPDLPELSLSPAMTIVAPYEGLPEIVED